MSAQEVELCFGAQSGSVQLHCADPCSAPSTRGFGVLQVAPEDRPQYLDAISRYLQLVSDDPAASMSDEVRPTVQLNSLSHTFLWLLSAS